MAIQKQPMMRKVVYALSPIALYSVYLYGWRSLAIIALSVTGGYLTEYLFMRVFKRKVSEAVIVTSLLYALSMPPMLPLWMVPVGIVFAVLLGKCAFGGFGRNIFNPAITGRAFLYLAFPGFMTASWMSPGGFGGLLNGGLSVDAVGSATRLIDLRNGAPAECPFDLLQKFFLGLRPGSLGESAVFLILIGAVFLLVTKTAQWRLMFWPVFSFTMTTAALYWMKIYGIASFALVTQPLDALLSGSVLFVAVFMATDPITAPKNNSAQVAYGAIIGLTIALVRFFSGSFPEGSAFGILTGNMFAPLLDQIFTKKKRKKAVSGEGK